MLEANGSKKSGWSVEKPREGSFGSVGSGGMRLRSSGMEESEGQRDLGGATE